MSDFSGDWNLDFNSITPDIGVSDAAWNDMMAGLSGGTEAGAPTDVFTPASTSVDDQGNPLTLGGNPTPNDQLSAPPGGRDFPDIVSGTPATGGTLNEPPTAPAPEDIVKQGQSFDPFKWIKDMSPGAQQVLLGGAVGLARALMSNSPEKAAMLNAQANMKSVEERQREFDVARQDAIRRGQVPALMHGTTKGAPTSGIVNAALGGPGYPGNTGR